MRALSNEIVAAIRELVQLNPSTENTCSTSRSGSTSRTRSSWCARGVPSCVVTPSSCPSHDAVGGFSFEFEAVRTTSLETAVASMASSRDSAAATPSS